VEAVLDALADRGLVSEARMAEAYVAERLRRGFGPVRIRHELRERGVPDDHIDPHLRKEPQEWLALMAEVHDKKFGPGPSGDRREWARRARFLEYRGFPADLIGRFLSRGETV
jgi:regulatory protein